MSTGLRGDERLVVWMPRWLGDFQMAEPLVAELARMWRAHPSRLTVVMPRAYRGLVDEAGYAGHGQVGFANDDECVRFEVVTLEDDAAVGAALGACEVALLLRGSFRSAWRVWRAGVPRRIGWARDGRTWLLTDSMAPARESRSSFSSQVLPRPFATDVQELAALVGVNLLRTEPRLIPNDEAQIAAATRIAAGGLNPAQPFVLINVGGRPGSAKAFPGWQHLAANLLADGIQIVIVTGPGEEARFEDVDHMLGPSLLLRDPVSSLIELAALASLAAVCVTSDGGPRHIFAAASSAPVVALFGPTDPRHTASHIARTVLCIGRVPCGPCHQETCPNIPESDALPERACFRAIDPEAILQATLSCVAAVRAKH